jgi:hypothetical protein
VISRSHTGVLNDGSCEVRVGEEVLTERFGRTDVVAGGEVFQRRTAEAAPTVTR